MDHIAPIHEYDPMQALLFEMTPREGHEDRYFDHAAKLRPILMRQDGLVFIERFKSLSRPKVILSHSLWRDEASLARWRTDSEHHKSQAAGRYKHFEDYRIRIAHVLSRYVQTAELKKWSKTGLYNDSDTTPDRYIVISMTSSQPTCEQGESFQSVTESNSFLTIREAVSEANGRNEVVSARSDTSVNSVLFSRVSRDYGMYDRTEAPQYFRPVEQ